MARLREEQARIEREIAAVESGVYQPLAESAALERTREIIALADNLAGDFRRVRDQFEQLNRDLRERITDNDGNRGDVLDTLSPASTSSPKAMRAAPSTRSGAC